jgi:protein phosphatase
MSNPPLTIQCSNPACLSNDTALGKLVCDRCQTPLVYSYLWAVGANTAEMIAGMVVGDRYVVMAPQVWLDTQPGQSFETKTQSSEGDVVRSINQAQLSLALPYLCLYAQRLHLPEVQGFYQDQGATILLLKNAPIDTTGKLDPALGAIWAQVTAVRQVYWFWQLLLLWTPLREQGVASSLLVPENIRVEGWRVRLRELIPDPVEMAPPLKDLASLWLTWIGKADSPVAAILQELCQQMQNSEESEATWQEITAQLNQLLLAQAAPLPLRLKVVSASTTGPQRTHNEDACFPLPKPQSGELLPQLAIVCDGIGGHAGGEVASQLAVRSLQLQVRALLTEVMEQIEPMSPDIVAQQLEAIVRVVNNVIAAQNDTQGRESRQRMGTTLVMALQLPQQVNAPTQANQTGNTHELYLVNVGDSRAYWLTARYCHLLTVDDDVATREVLQGRSLLAEAIQRSDAGALTQALGTRDAEFLHPTIQRFVIEEDGLLLLCSDGLSDNQVVEQTWQETTPLVFKGKITLEAAAQSWLNLANQRNGHDNASVVLMWCQVSAESPHLFEPTALPGTVLPSLTESELSESSRELLYGETAEAPVVAPAALVRQSFSFWAVRVLLVLIAGGLGLIVWRQLNPVGFDRTWAPIFPSTQEQNRPTLPPAP